MKRANGTGSVHKDKVRNRWVGRISDPSTGKRHTVHAKTRIDLEAKMAAIRTGLQRGEEPEDGQLTVAQACDAWERRTLAGRDPATSTRDNYRWALRLICHPDTGLGGRRAKALTVDQVERWLDAQRTVHGAKPLSRKSYVRLKSTLGQVLDDAVRRGQLHRNVARIAHLPAETTAPREKWALTPDQLHALDMACKERRVGPVLAFMAGTGCRPGEALGLRWDDLDLDQAVATIRRTVRRDGNRVRVVDQPKTPAGYRSLAMPPVTVAAMKAHQAKQRRARLAALSWEDPALVFPTRVGSVWHPRNFGRDVAAAASAAGLDGFSPNLLRHTAASLLIDAGVPLAKVADQLGHATLRMVSEVYRHRVGPVIDAGAGPLQQALSR